MDEVLRVLRNWFNKQRNKLTVYPTPAFFSKKHKQVTDLAKTLHV